MDRLLLRAKNEAHLPSLDLMAQLFLIRFAKTILQDPPELIIPIPLSHQRLRERGYNQAAELAARIGRELGISVNSKLLTRTHHTASQQTLSAKERQANLRRAFRAENIEAGHIAILDDVITTGATVTAAARALENACDRRRQLRIEAWSIARTPARSV